MGVNCNFKDYCKYIKIFNDYFSVVNCYCMFKRVYDIEIFVNSYCYYYKC